ncbi:amidase family protein [Roseomonas sp. CAU 1739]|uniref:amidase n=1 Tax=Roseomonas sp. CAU 1739 TaxID=3140364 RepID=UPI00325AD011
MPTDDLLFMSATHAAALIRRGALSPVTYVDTVLAAIAQAQPVLNCFVTIDEEGARRDSLAAERAVASGATLGPLHGVPVHIKDLIDVAGMRTANGSAIFAEAAPAKRDDVLVARLRSAGAIVIGKTTTPEFGAKGLTDGPAFGATRNPWNLGRTSGGSSGGAAAAVAAGLAPIGLGTDGAGSIRGPAACCGLVGLKPTLGAVPADTARDTFGNNTYAGPLTRTVTDAAVMHSILAGPSAQDPWSLGGAGVVRPLSPSLMGEDLSALRIGYIPRCANPRVAGDVAANTRAALDAWAAMGAVVEEVTDAIDWIEYEGRVMYQANFAVFCAPYLPQWGNRMDPVTLAFMERGARFTLADFRNAQFARTRLFRAMQALFDRYDVLVTPTMARTALPIDFDAANDDVMIDGQACGITRQGWTSPQYPFNLTGHPAVSLPSGFGDDGLPTAVQVVGRWGAEADILRLGALLEAARPWAGRRPVLSP